MALGFIVKTVIEYCIFHLGFILNQLSRIVIVNLLFHILDGIIFVPGAEGEQTEFHYDLIIENLILKTFKDSYYSFCNHYV